MTQSATSAQGCIICAIVTGRAEASVVYEDEAVVAFMDLYPVTPGHLLVVPRGHAVGLDDLDAATSAHVWSVGHEMARAMRRSSLGCEGINVLLCDGEVAFQTVFHFHLHVIPRYGGDGWTIKGESQERARPLLESDAQAIKAAIASTARGPGGAMRMSVPTPTLHTARLRLRPFTDADADDLFALHSNAHVLRYWDSPPWTDRARAGRFIEKCQQLSEEGSGARVAMERASDGAFLGWCGLTKWNPGYRSASLGYCLDDAAWGHGYATEAARALLQWGFDTLDLNRVQAEADTRNAASARVLEKLGFVLEGTLREDCIVNGDVSDSWVYGLLRREWQA